MTTIASGAAVGAKVGAAAGAVVADGVGGGALPGVRPGAAGCQGQQGKQDEDTLEGADRVGHSWLR